MEIAVMVFMALWMAVGFGMVVYNYRAISSGWPTSVFFRKVSPPVGVLIMAVASATCFWISGWIWGGLITLTGIAVVGPVLLTISGSNFRFYSVFFLFTGLIGVILALL